MGVLQAKGTKALGFSTFTLGRDVIHTCVHTETYADLDRNAVQTRSRKGGPRPQ
jgi:hypothetical protein